MRLLEEIVEIVKSKTFVGIEVECIYGTTMLGQRFAILITTVGFLIYY